MNQVSLQGIIPSVNFHLWQPCNMRCGFCFAHFQDVKKEMVPKGHLPRKEALEVVRQLAEFGFRKITFAGGEPTLCPWLPNLVREAKSYGMVTMIVTNGTRISGSVLEEYRGSLDWITISMDSPMSKVNAGSGRVVPGQVPFTEEDYFQICHTIRESQIRLKINTVVHRYNQNDNFVPFMLAAQPERWKILQVIEVADQNGEEFQRFEISTAEFQAFVDRHACLRNMVEIVPEPESAIRGTYLMIDPGGRFFDNVLGAHQYGDPIAEVGVERALQSVSFSLNDFIKRGGLYY